MKRIVSLGGMAAILVVLGSCTSPFLLRIREEVARAPFTATSYRFAAQFGSAHPEYAFQNPIVKADTAGNVYVADSSFRIRKFNTAGTLLLTLSCVSLKGPSARLYDMAFDTSGNIYVVTNSTLQIQKYNSAGTLVAEWGGATVYGATVLDSPRAITVNSVGEIFIADMFNYRIVKLDSLGSFLTSFGVYDLAGDGGGEFQRPIAILVDRFDNVYVLDEYTSYIQRFSSAGGYLGQWGDLTYGTLNLPLSSPAGMAISPGSTQYIYVADTNNSRCLKFSTGGIFQTGFDWGSAGTLDGQFTDPESIATDSSGIIYVADSPGSEFGGRIQKFNGTASPVTWLASWGGGAGSAAGSVAAPWGVAFDPSGNVLVVDIINSRVSKFSPAGSFIDMWGAPGSGPGQFAFPIGIAADAAGTMYIIELSNSRFTVLDAAGTFLRTVGSSGTGDGFFSSPVGITVDSSGFIIVADSGNERVEVFNPDFTFLRKFGSLGPGDGQFESNAAYSIAVSPSGDIYVSDWQANRVQKFDSQGNFLLKWGTLGTGDGEFNAAMGLAVDKIGNVFVCDMANRRVQKFDSNGNFLAKFGIPGSGNGGFGWPVGVAVDSHGNVAVSDYTGALVQVFYPAF